MNGPEISDFGTLLTDVFDEDGIDDVLLRINRGDLDRHVKKNAAFPVRIRLLIGVANSGGWLIELIQQVALSRANNVRVKSFIASYKYLDPANNPVLANPWDSHKLLAGKLFLGRPNLRSFLRQMEDPFDRKVLVITSARRQIGKSYTADLVQFVSHGKPLSRVTYIDLDVDTFDLRSLARKIAVDWNIDPDKLPTPDQEQAARWSQQLTKFLIRTPPVEDPVIRWILLDGFRERVLPPEIQEFIEQMAAAVQSNDAFRLILLNYTQPLPITIKFLCFSHTVTQVTVKEIKLALMDIVGTKAGRPIPPKECQEYLAGVRKRWRSYQQQNPEHKDSQLLLHIAVSETIGSIR